MPSQEEMWRVIQRQQKTIDALQDRLDHAEKSRAATPAEAQAQPRVEEIDRKTGVLAEEVEKLKTRLSIPDQPEYKSRYGLGPGASKVYGIDHGVSLGGYGNAFYRNLLNDKGGGEDQADLERLVLYAGYKFNDHIIFNSEIEYEHATTGEGAEEKGEVSVELAYLDFLFHPMVNARAGLVLLPMGFINEMHEPTTFHGNFRPEVERRIIPATWREIGAGLFGELLPGLQYRVYGVNGLNAAEFSSAGIRDGRQSGSQALAEDLAFSGRLDYTPEQVPGLLLGASTYLGDSGQENSFAGRKPDVFTQLYEGHLQYRYRGLELRTLGVWGHVDDASLLSAAKGETIGEENYGWYVEAAYDVLPLLRAGTGQYLAPFFRYEQFDTVAEAPAGFPDDPGRDIEVYQVGIDYKPIPNVVIKADYRDFDSEGGDLPDEFNLGVGLMY
ncbi:MAG: hypothetical protein ACREWG_17800 [Gammaproteobacteria bacterium]